jgi:hypothetical protein
MSIERGYGTYTAVCDICGAELNPAKEFSAAVDNRRREGWKGRKVRDADNEIVWQDICPDCWSMERGEAYA